MAPFANDHAGNLIDGRAVANRSGDDNGVDGVSSGRDREAVEYFYSIYHAQPPQSVAVCHAVTLQEATRQAWSWPAKLLGHAKVAPGP